MRKKLIPAAIIGCLLTSSLPFQVNASQVPSVFPLPVGVDNTTFVYHGNRDAEYISTDGRLFIDRKEIAQDVVAYEGGRDLCMFIKADGTLWAYGVESRNDYSRWPFYGYGQPGTPLQIMEGVRSISHFSNYALVIKTDNTLWGWGNDSSGQLTGDSASGGMVDTPIKIMDNVLSASAWDTCIAVVKTDGSLWNWGLFYPDLSQGTPIHGPGTITEPAKLGDGFVAVYVDQYAPMALKADGSLWAWGSNFQSEFGNGESNHTLEPVKVMDNISSVSFGDMVTAIVKTDGSLWTWGDNFMLDLGVGNDSQADSLIPVQIGEGFVSVNVDGGEAALKADGTVYAWGFENMSVPTEVLTGVKLPDLSGAAPAPAAIVQTPPIQNDLPMFIPEVSVQEVPVQEPAVQENSIGLQTGDYLGDVLYSDIIAYINGLPVPTSITNGRTMVVAEDLRNYGFDVVWDGGAWSLFIAPNPNLAYSPIHVEPNTMPVGTVKYPYVYTTIKTYLSGQQVDSYAIDGQTLIDFEQLGKYGAMVWNSADRSLSLTIQ